MENKRRFKLNYVKGSAYRPNNNQWAFVRKIKGGYEVLAHPVSCKDYIHEAIANKVNGSHCFYSCGSSHETPINMDKFQIAMFYQNNDKNFKANLYSVKKYINSLEKAAGIPQTSIIEVDSTFIGTRAFIITADRAYIESPALHHALVAMMRTLHYAEKPITKSNIEQTISSIKYKDYYVLGFMLKHKVYDILLKNHARIAKLNLNKVYPSSTNNLTPKGNGVSSYHSGFGMVAVCSRKMASKDYSDEVIKILEENKVPIYPGG